MNAVVPPRPKVLARKGGDGNAKGTHNHPEEAVNLAVSGPGRGGINTKGVDAGLDDDVGDGVHHALEPRRQADYHNTPQHCGIKGDLPRLQVVYLGGAGKGENHQHRADDLGKEGPQGNPQHPQGDVDHQKDIQNNVYQAASHQEVQGPAGIPHRPENAGAHVIDKVGDDAQKVDSDIGNGVGKDIGRGVHGDQGHGGDDPADNHEGKSPRQRKGHGGVDGPLCAVAVPGAVELRDDYRRAGGDTHKQPHQKVDEGAGSSAHRGQGLLAHKPPHNHGIGGVVKLLEKGPQQNGKKEGKQRLPDDAAGDAVLCGKGLLLHSENLLMKKRPLPRMGKRTGFDTIAIGIEYHSFCRLSIEKRKK